MRPLEWLIVATSLLAIVCFLQPRPPSSTLWLGVAAALLVMLHAWLEGMHWQMAPAYLAVALTLFVTATGLTSPMLRLSCGIMAGAMVAASLVLSWILPMFKLPAPTGRYPVGTRTLYLTTQTAWKCMRGRDRVTAKSSPSCGIRQLRLNGKEPCIEGGRKPPAAPPIRRCSRRTLSRTHRWPPDAFQ